MRIDLEDWEGNSRFAKYKIFRLESAKDMYTLRVFGYSGDAGQHFLDNPCVKDGWMT